jgi:DEAD/DEAH box helicase domain-containing protein
MNALADDQAKRIAQLVHRTREFHGLRAGLFVGSGKGRYRPGQAGRSPDRDHAAMGADHVITDKDILRDQPPDILLTNYKMLDFLLIRPKDQPLWRFNAPDTLRYLVVDELHTFDGAQGTDLAMLIRRLRRRLKGDAQDDPGRLVCIGTSATLGDAADTRPLRDYAGQIFAAAFDEHSVITEQRQGFDAFIGNRVVEHLLADDETVLQAIRPHSFDHPQDAVARYLPAFFAHPATLSALQAGIDTPEGRLRLGEELKKHLLFQSLIRLATQAPITVEEIADKLQRTLSARLIPESRALISALLTLVAWARAPKTRDDAAADKASALLDFRSCRPDQDLAADLPPSPVKERGPGGEVFPTGPHPLPPSPCRERGNTSQGDKAELTNADLTHLVTLRVQLWLQELRRVLSTVSRDPTDIALGSEAAILSRSERLRLPLIQCRHCHATGWLTVKAPQDSRVNAGLDRIYGAFFARYPDTLLHRLYPLDPESKPALPVQTLCGHCGHLGREYLTQCPHCLSEDLVPVQVANAQRTLRLRDDSDTRRDAREVSIHDDRCPICGERGGQLIVGAQTTSLAAHAVERLWAARLNDHKKLILFSDSVQDAAHRAGYIESKTEGMLTRAALAQALKTLPEVMPWDRALDAVGRAWLDPAGPLALSPSEFVARFIPPSMEGHRDWRSVQARGELPPNSRLPAMLAQRLQWRAAEELAHRSDRGRTLSRVGIAVLFPDPADLQTLTDALTPELRELGGGLERLHAEQVRHWTLGTLLALIRAGALFHLELESYAESGNFGAFEFSPPRKPWIPHRGHSVPPRFVTRDPGRHGFLHLQEHDGNPL